MQRLNALYTHTTEWVCYVIIILSMAISFHQEFINFTENAKSVILTVKMFFALVFSNNCEISDIVQRYCVDSLFQQVMVFRVD